MDVHTLEYMIAIEETGHVSKAAEKCFVSQSAVSQSLARQETAAGEPLFTRTGGRLVPTEAGRLYLQGAREIVQIKNEVYRSISDLSDTKSRVRLFTDALLDSMVRDLLVPALREEYPDTRLDILSGTSELGKQYLANELADLAILCLPFLKNSIMDQTVLKEVRLAAYISSIHYPAVPGEAAAEQLRNIPCILLKKGTAIRRLEDQLLSSVPLSPVRVFEVDSFEDAAAFLKDGRGIALLPAASVPPSDRTELTAITAGSFQIMLVRNNYLVPTRGEAAVFRHIRTIPLPWEP